jgi:LytS/YehU family sensor histidine kinase
VDVEIAADRVGDTLRLRVRDSGGDPQAPAEPGLGIGLRNVAARLAGHYGERGALRCNRLTPKGFMAEIRLPLEFACTRFAA